MSNLFKRAVVLTWATMLVVIACGLAVLVSPFALAYFWWEDYHETKEDDEEMYNCR